MDTEGVVHYRLSYQPGDLPAVEALGELLAWFVRCRTRGLIGQDPHRYDGLAYGNLSVRATRGFVISGTQTGGKTTLSRDDLAWVLDFDLADNHLTASGPARPSSEAMTHGQVYRCRSDVNAVIHVHAPALWQRAAALGLPATPGDAAYGTPAMARAVDALLAQADARCGVFVMAGHTDGCVAFGPDMAAAGDALLEAVARAGDGRA